MAVIEEERKSVIETAFGRIAAEGAKGLCGEAQCAYVCEGSARGVAFKSGNCGFHAER